MFKTLTQDPANPTQSLPLLIVDPGVGAWLTYRITNYRDGNNATTCTVLNPACIVGGVNVPCVEVNADPENANNLNPPGGVQLLANLPNLVVGSQFTALRVCNGWLEQKNGTFDPAADANCPALAAGTVEFPDYVIKTGWSPLLPNVEDFQVAYAIQQRRHVEPARGHALGRAGLQRRRSQLRRRPRHRQPVRRPQRARPAHHGRRALLHAGSG